MHTTPLEDERANYGGNADIILTIAKSEIKDLIAEKAARIYPESAQAEVQSQIEEALVNMLKPSSNAAMNEIKQTFARSLAAVVIAFFSCGAADDIILQCFE